MLNFYSCEMGGNTSLLELNNAHNWNVEFCFEIFQLFFYSDKYADLIYNSIHLGAIKPELKNYEVSSCFFVHLMREIYGFFFQCHALQSLIF